MPKPKTMKLHKALKSLYLFVVMGGMMLTLEPL